MLGAMPAEEVILNFPAARREQVIPTTHVKGTWLASAVRGLRLGGYLDAYLGYLSPKYRDIMTHTVASEWRTVDVLAAHYGACDRLELSAAAILDLGRLITKHAAGSVIAVTARLAANAVLTPW